VSFNGLIWEGVSDNAKDLISKLLVKSPDVRLTAVEALNHPYLLKGMTSHNTRTQMRDIDRKPFIVSEVPFEPLIRLCTVHCARISQQTSLGSSNTNELTSRFEQHD
jgi:calcium/calmodulin-dependent protein kinase I